MHLHWDQVAWLPFRPISSPTPIHALIRTVLVPNRILPIPTVLSLLRSVCTDSNEVASTPRVIQSKHFESQSWGAFNGAFYQSAAVLTILSWMGESLSLDWVFISLLTEIPVLFLLNHVDADSRDLFRLKAQFQSLQTLSKRSILHKPYKSVSLILWERLHVEGGDSEDFLSLLFKGTLKGKGTQVYLPFLSL